MPRVQHLEIAIDYSQVYLEPFEPTDEENALEIEWNEANYDRGMWLSSTNPDEAVPIHVDAGSYDVLATFSNEAAMASSLRRFDLQLTFFAAGALGAPRTFRREGLDRGQS
jgi:hypothetical protein